MPRALWSPRQRAREVDSAATLYLDLMKRCLTNWIYTAPEELPARQDGSDILPQSHTMIGLERINNL